jgi:hypothetical protein
VNALYTAIIVTLISLFTAIGFAQSPQDQIDEICSEQCASAPPPLPTPAREIITVMVQVPEGYLTATQGDGEVTITVWGDGIVSQVILPTTGNLPASYSCLQQQLEEILDGEEIYGNPPQWTTQPSPISQGGEEFDGSLCPTAQGRAATDALLNPTSTVPLDPFTTLECDCANWWQSNGITAEVPPTPSPIYRVVIE